VVEHCLCAGHPPLLHPPFTPQVHVEEPPGDILVFLTGQEEIDSLARLLGERSAQLPEGGQGGQELLVLPIYAALPPDQQVKVC
jgi:HrpA-like RNA helicase